MFRNDNTFALQHGAGQSIVNLLLLRACTIRKIFFQKIRKCIIKTKDVRTRHVFVNLSRYII